jgi:hypothetical protein
MTSGVSISLMMQMMMMMVSFHVYIFFTGVHGTTYIIGIISYILETTVKWAFPPPMMAVFYHQLYIGNHQHKTNCGEASSASFWTIISKEADLK